MALQIWLPLNGDLHNQGLNNNITATNNGATVNNNGKIGKCYQFGTAASNISLPAAAGSSRYQVATYMNSPSPTDNSATGEYYIVGNCNLSSVSNISISWWMYPEQGYASNITNGVFCTTANNIGSDYTISAFNHYDSNIRINASDGNFIKVSTSSFIKNAWHYYTLTFDGLTAKLYRDGVLQTSSAFSENKILGNFTKILIGHSRAGSVHRKIKGKYSDFRIYVTVLTPEQVADLYHTSMSIDNQGNPVARELSEL